MFKGDRFNPPSWHPNFASQYPLKEWTQDFVEWYRMHTDVGPAGQVARFMHGLDHQWRETLQSIFTPEMQTLGTVRGDPPHPVDPISTLCHILYEHFGRIGDSQIVELAQKRTAFARRPDETFEMTVIRFEDLRRKCREATGEQVNWTLEASDLLNVMNIAGRDRIDALRPFGGRPPSTPMQYEEMKLNLRFSVEVVMRVYSRCMLTQPFGLGYG